ncbi:unnamed protein product [Owenia fusiformis]|uniref:Uncharacterized protein n=1 Tax=Owenia fusiformis TaxID=6347 RepID=A0A8J1XJF2_OWEFU|nr:unnamed protein product [Owenia fusiformis]
MCNRTLNDIAIHTINDLGHQVIRQKVLEVENYTYISSNKMSDTNGSSVHNKIRDVPTLWLRKILTFINIHDFDKDGFIGHEDLMQLGDKMKQLAVTEKSKDELRELLSNRYKVLKKRSEHGGTTTMTEQILQFWEQKDDPVAIEQWRKTASAVFKILDSKNNGSIPFDDFVGYWKVLGLDTTYAQLQFDYIDTNQDGFIDEEEVVNARVEYFTNTDEHNCNRFYGPLVNY